MKKTITAAIAVVIGGLAVTPTSTFAGRKGFCAGEPNFKECVNADRGAKRRHYHPDAYSACAELAEYVSRKGRLEWDQCLAKEDRAIKGRSKR